MISKSHGKRFSRLLYLWTISSKHKMIGYRYVGHFTKLKLVCYPSAFSRARLLKSLLLLCHNSSRFNQISTDCFLFRLIIVQNQSVEINLVP